MIINTMYEDNQEIIYGVEYNTARLNELKDMDPYEKLCAYNSSSSNGTHHQIEQYMKYLKLCSA